MQALRMDASTLDGGWVCVALSSDVSTEVADVLSSGIPTALVVSVKEPHRFLSRPHQFVDRGRKHESKPLKDLLLRQNRCPYIAAGYQKPGRVRRGIARLLSKAAEIGECNLYVIGVPDDLFRFMLEQTAPASPEAAASDPMPPDPVPSEGQPSEQRLSKVYRLPVSERIRETYLGRSEVVATVWQQIVKAAPAPMPAWILGPSGSGKELIANLIHLESGRPGRFVAVNCCELTEELAPTELFGHVEGAFTGAIHARRGFFRDAHRGTLFLDEIGDLAPRIQGMLLRVIEERTVTPVGTTDQTAVDVRLVTASHRDLSQMVHERTFREDLFQRLRGYLIRTPALSQHPEDIPLLAARFWTLACGDRPGRLPDDVLGFLERTDWPGNARELKSFLGGLRFNYPTIDAPDLALVQDWLVEWRQGHPIQRASQRRRISTWLVAEQIERLEVLRVSNKILRDCKVAVRPFAVDHRADRETLAGIRESLTKSLDELERLTRDPNWFRSWEAFDMVRHVKGQYTTFVALLERHPRKALKLWDDELLQEQTDAARKLSDVRREVEEIVLRHGELGDDHPSHD